MKFFFYMIRESMEQKYLKQAMVFDVLQMELQRYLNILIKINTLISFL